MPTIGPYTFSIVSNGRTLHEYEPPADEDSETSENCRVVYIEAVEGSKFKIHGRSIGPLKFATGSLGLYLCLDGDSILHEHLSKSAYNNSLGATFTWDYVSWPQDGIWVEQNFQFSNLTTTDTVPHAADLKKIAQHAGTIQVLVRDQAALRTENISNVWRRPEKSMVPEKALKGQPIDMSAGCGETKPTTRRMGVTTHRPVGTSLFRFVFKYRSRKALQMLDLLPTTPEPAALQERDPNTLNLAEARELLSQIRRQGKHMSVVKQEDTGMKRERQLNASPKTLEPNDRKRKAGSMIDNQDGSDDDDLIFVGAKKIRSMPEEKVEVIDLS